VSGCALSISQTRASFSERRRREQQAADMPQPAISAFLDFTDASACSNGRDPFRRMLLDHFAPSDWLGLCLSNGFFHRWLLADEAFWAAMVAKAQDRARPMRHYRALVERLPGLAYAALQHCLLWEPRVHVDFCLSGAEFKDLCVKMKSNRCTNLSLARGADASKLRELISALNAQCTLTELSCSHFPQDCGEWHRLLLECPFLRFLGLRSNGITSCANFGHLPSTLTWLDLSSNRISDCHPIGVALRGNSTLRRLRLDDNCIADVEGLAEGLAQNRGLKVLALRNNSVCKVAALVGALKTNESLEALFLAGNPIAKHALACSDMFPRHLRFALWLPN
jgi:hypothetical protein